MASVIGGIPSALYFDVNCMDHQQHLVCKGGLVVIDEILSEFKKPFKYYTSICKLTNVWRDLAKTVYAVWVRIFGASDAAAHALHLPARCVAGRWSSVNSCELRYTRAGRTKIALVMKLAIMHKGRIPSDSADSADISLVSCRDELAGIAIEEQRACTTKIGRWRSDVVSLCTSPEERCFWNIMEISHRVHGPGEHFHNFLLQHQAALPRAGSIHNARGPIALLATGKARDIFNEYDDMLGSSWWHSIIVDGSLCQHDQDMLWRLATALI
eukprot:6016008-Pyramimonas_sp.AAC.2